MGKVLQGRSSEFDFRKGIGLGLSEFWGSKEVIDHLTQEILKIKEVIQKKVGGKESY